MRLPGLTPYRPLWEQQQELAAARRRNEIGDRLLLLEHDHVYTNGRRGKPEHLLVPEETLASLGASYVEVDRGGDITYHGPGQLVGYAIVDLARAGLGVRAYVRALEEVLLRTAAHFMVAATTMPGYPGIWIGDAKLGAIGVKVSRSVTYHGFSLNIDPDLAYFDRIIACGLADRDVTSLAQQLGHPIAVDDVIPICAEAFAEVFGVEIHWLRPSPQLLSKCAGRGADASRVAILELIPTSAFPFAQRTGEPGTREAGGGEGQPRHHAALITKP